MERTHFLAPWACVGPDRRIGSIKKGQGTVEVVRTATLVHVLDGCLAISAIDERQANPDAPGEFT
ncbi:hypothetical protein D3C72_2484400 [compost metagenome]